MKGIRLTKEWKPLERLIEVSLRRMFGYGVKVGIKKMSGNNMSRRRMSMKTDIINEVRILKSKSPPIGRGK